MTSTDWRGRTALVTGASRGIGRVIAEGLAAEGLHLVLSARDEEKLAATREACEGRGVEVRALARDLRRADDRVALVEEAGDFDVLVNNAGVEIPIALTNQTAEDVEAQITTNLLAPIELTRLALPRLLGRSRGAVVNVSSMSGKSATPYNAVYAATKHGLNGFTASLRLELADTAVTAGVVCPSFVAQTGMWADLGMKPPRLLREVPPRRVVQAVLRVMEGGAEVLVTPSPMRPLLALNALFPGMDGPVLRWIGVLSTLRDRAQRVAETDQGR